MCDSETDFVSLTEAAQLLDTTETQVRMMLEKNEVQGKMVDDAWQVDLSSINLRNKQNSADIVSSDGCGICGSGCGRGC
ncbi:MAG: hypothetical protein A2076_10980 [Geobacteraceae bacterium GWC2_53_11]|nr:MAG: hypothetical protein A2076_10980 [Geobacteraceae bacterium GWC2_53_11]